jgi:hypothetical protein
MFDVNNEEGKEEAIIDHELHSDDEIIFESKIKQPLKLTKDKNLKKIKELVPKVDLTLIDFNKQKIIKEADLYSVRKREFENEDIEEQIEEIKKKNQNNKILRRKNKKKVLALENFINKLRKDLRLLKKLKLTISVQDDFFRQKDSDNENSTIKKEFNGMEEIKEDENELEDNDDSVEDNVTYTDRSDSSDKNKDLNIKNSKKNYFEQEEVDQIKIKRNTKRRNSK